MMRRTWRTGLVFGVLAAAFAVAPLACSGFGPSRGAAGVAPPRPAESLAPFIEAELKKAAIPGFAIALVDRGGPRWSRSFGAGAGPQSQWRVGSVSKMFTDLAVLQLVEAGRLDLDAPVTQWLGDFQPKNPFGTP